MPKGGWFVNVERSRRRWAPQTLTDGQVFEVLDQITKTKGYSSMDVQRDRMIRSRDQAAIALSWIWPKRGLEILSLRVTDVSTDGGELSVSFRIEKRLKTWRVCPTCKRKGERERQYKNARDALFCKHCGGKLTPEDETKFKPEPSIVVKRKSLKYIFCRSVKTWHQESRDYIESLPKSHRPSLSDAYLFPRFHSPSSTVDFEKHITTKRLDQILQRFDSSLTSHLFRYGKTEQLFQRGYSTPQVQEAGDWQSERMPSIYAKRKGLTPSAKEFAADVRVDGA